jgi:general secretion pathway protein A
MFETFFGFKKPPFGSDPEPRQLFPSAPWAQMRARLEFLVEHRGVGLFTGEVGSGKSTAVRAFLTALNPNLFKIAYLHWTSGSTLDLLRLLARRLDLEPAFRRADLLQQISEAVVRLHQTHKRHPVLVLDEAQMLGHESLELLPPLLNFEMDSRSYLSLVLVGQPLLRRTLSLAMHEALRQRVAVHYHLEGLARDELDAYLDHQLQAAGVREPLFDETARRALYQATKGIPRKVNKLALAALRLAASRKSSQVDEPILLDAAREALL